LPLETAEEFQWMVHQRYFEIGIRPFEIFYSGIETASSYKQSFMVTVNAAEESGIYRQYPQPVATYLKYLDRPTG
jgi:hypothetical protein